MRWAGGVSVVRTGGPADPRPDRVAGDPTRLRNRVDWRPLRGRHRCRRGRHGRPRLGPRHPDLRHGAALRLRRRRATTRHGTGRPAARRVRPLVEGRPAGSPHRVDPTGRGCRPPGIQRPRGRVLCRRPASPHGLRLHRGRRPPVDRGEPRAAPPRPHRHCADPRSGRALGAGDRAGLARRSPGCATRA